MRNPTKIVSASITIFHKPLAMQNDVSILVLYNIIVRTHFRFVSVSSTPLKVRPPGELKSILNSPND